MQNSKNKNIREPLINLVKDENGDLLADPYNILNRWNTVNIAR
jgi:hypothetical protein